MTSIICISIKTPQPLLIIASSQAEGTGSKSVIALLWRYSRLEIQYFWSDNSKFKSVNHFVIKLPVDSLTQGSSWQEHQRITSIQLTEPKAQVKMAKSRLNKISALKVRRGLKVWMFPLLSFPFCLLSFSFTFSLIFSIFARWCFLLNWAIFKVNWLNQVESANKQTKF